MNRCKLFRKNIKKNFFFFLTEDTLIKLSKRELLALALILKFIGI